MYRLRHRLLRCALGLVVVALLVVAGKSVVSDLLPCRLPFTEHLLGLVAVLSDEVARRNDHTPIWALQCSLTGLWRCPSLGAGRICGWPQERWRYAPWTLADRQLAHPGLSQGWSLVGWWLCCPPDLAWSMCRPTSFVPVSWCCIFLWCNANWQ